MQYGLLKEDYFQWDTGQRVELYPDGDDEITELHMYNNRIGGPALVMEVKTDEDGILYADIPALLFRLPGRIIFWRVVSDVDGMSTKEEYDGINVIPRAKPTDYVYTAPDVLNYKELLALYDTLTKEYQELVEQIKEGSINGGSSVWIGTEAPPDDSYVLWVDTDDDSGGEGGVSFTPGANLELTEDGVLNVLTADEAEAGNTRPITSAAVAATVGNIEILLQTI